MQRGRGDVHRPGLEASSRAVRSEASLGRRRGVRHDDRSQAMVAVDLPRGRGKVAEDTNSMTAPRKRPRSTRSTAGSAMSTLDLRRSPASINHSVEYGLIGVSSSRPR